MSKTISRHLNRFLLDPNNYRFIDNKDYRSVEEGDISNPRIQERTFNLLAGKNNENILDLIKSFKSNGILKDPIQVKELPDGNYLVVEGNRRTAALKQLYRDFQEAKDTGKMEEKDFKSIEVVLISDESPVEHLITMGIHHISGKRKWSPVNQAQLIRDLVEKYKIPEADVCDSLAITKHNLKRSLRTLALIDRYKASDFGDQFQTNMYSVFEEIIKNTKVKAWLQWSDSTMSPENSLNEERLFQWISTEYTTEENEIDEEVEITKEPIITKSHEIRELSKFIDDPEAVDKMENSRSITEAFALSDAVGESRLKNAMQSISKEVNTAFQFSEYLKDDDYQQIEHLKIKLDRLIPSFNSNAVVSAGYSTKQYFLSISSHFDSVEINKYKKLKNTFLRKTGRVNIIAGGNNSGKTSLLEAIYLQANLNDVHALIELERIRGNFGEEIPSNWIDEIFQDEIIISSVFNETESALEIAYEQTDEHIDKSNYIKSIICQAQVKNDFLDSKMHLYANREPTLYYDEVKKLCTAAISSPFRYTPKLLERAHAKAIEEQYLTKIISFIRKYIDPKILKIELTTIDKIKRFMVSLENSDLALDLTQYGEGVQRVFEIGLLIGYCKNGVLCVDEIDSAIHKNLLIDFTAFIQKLADEFNVQVFLTTHSKECIDAFVQNNYPDDNLIAYALSNEEESTKAKFLEGNKLKSLVESINIDIR
ncbi:ATPase/GTPase, AAA15 family [Salegentibacter echinorum]|uniref:ATPase/GTPase, AAA15 family n=1 Tax=Salegentibacter echinorum TaxID=1073325 RepID=A0A1M5LT82_SALEC|nr:AAA family ATPase [Salegentibacter echinorum]SHG68205.1 ATPase/GTPase, AAA15 family [Salegentibacter echinorum]